MSNALPVLVVPDADDTTRRVLSALRAAALAEAPPPAEEPPSDYLLRWDRPTALRLEPSATPVRGADGRVLFVEGTLSASEASTNAGTPALSLTAPQGVVPATPTPETPAKGASESDLVAALLAFAEAASRARTPEEACTAAVVAAEQVLGTRRVAIMRKEPSGALLLGAASQAFEAPLYAQLANPAVWSDTDVPSLTTALPDIEDTSAAWLPDAMRPFLDHPRHRAALLLPLLHRDHAVGLLWAFYEAPQVFDLSMRQRGGVLAHHLSATLAAAAASTWGQSMETYPVVKVSPTKTNPADEPPAADEPSQPELPLKALVGLATVAAFGMEQAEDGAWNVVWATKSFRKLIDVGPERALSLSDVLAAVHPSDARGVFAAINEVAVGAPVRFDHRLVTPDGQTRWVRQAITRRDEEGADELLVVLLDIDPDRAALRRAEEALEEARRRASTSVLGPLSESLRVPITTILDRAQVLGQSGPVRDNERHHLAREIAEQGRGLLASLNLMVDLARIEAGDVDLVRSDLDVHEAVGRVFDVLGPLASRKGLTIEAHKGGARCIVHQDPHALSRVLHHVVSTAITQAPPGTLRLRTDEVEGTVRLSLRSEAIPAREHEPGRTSPLTSPLSGLIAERLLALMGGRLYTEATATAPFYVRLELPSVHRGAPAAASSEAPVETPAETQAAEPLPTVRPADRALPGDDRVAAASTNTKDGKELRSQVTAAAGEDATAAVVAMDNAGEEIAAPEEIAAEEIAAEEVAAEELPLRSTPVRQHASLEAAANALMLFDPIAEDVAEPVSTDPIADTAVPADAEPKPYARTEVVLPVGVQLPKTARPARKESAPTSRGADANARSTDVTLPAFDTALDAFAGVAEQPPAPAKPAEAREGSGQGRVLVVEDSTETRLLLERLIAREFEVVAVETPRAALDALTRYPFDALVLDINLGGRETGLDVLRIARSLDGYADTFAMAVTAYGDEEDRDRFLTAGFQAYVQKPFDPHRILEPLRSAIAVAIGQETT